MILSEAIKPISYLKVHASELIRDVTDNKKTMIITQNSKAIVVIKDIRLYEQTQESLAMLKILAISRMILKGRKKSNKIRSNDRDRSTTTKYGWIKSKKDY